MIPSPLPPFSPLPPLDYLPRYSFVICCRCHRCHQDVNTLTEHGVDIPGDTIRCNPLFAACVTGQLEAIDWLLSHGADATVPSEYGYTPLHAGAYRNQVAVIELLFDKATKLDIDAVDEFGASSPRW